MVSMDVTDTLPDLDQQWQALTLDDSGVNNTDIEIGGVQELSDNRISKAQLDFVTDEPRQFY